MSRLISLLILHHEVRLLWSDSGHRDSELSVDIVSCQFRKGRWLYSDETNGYSGARTCYVHNTNPS